MKLTSLHLCNIHSFKRTGVAGSTASECHLIDFVIPDAEFNALNQLDRHERYNYPFRWGIDVFDELGVKEAERRVEEHAAKLRAAM